MKSEGPDRREGRVYLLAIIRDNGAGGYQWAKEAPFDTSLGEQSGGEISRVHSGSPDKPFLRLIARYGMRCRNWK